MTDTEVHDGGCLCGALRYRVAEPIESVVHCHCAMCRRASGAPVVSWLTVPVARFAFTKGAPATYNSSDHGERAFCPACGAQLTFRSSRRPDDVDVTLGTLDDAEGFAAEYHIFTASRLPRLRLDEHLPAYPGFSTGVGT